MYRRDFREEQISLVEPQVVPQKKKRNRSRKKVSEIYGLSIPVHICKEMQSHDYLVADRVPVKGCKVMIILLWTGCQ